MRGRAEVVVKTFSLVIGGVTGEGVRWTQRWRGWRLAARRRAVELFNCSS